MVKCLVGTMIMIILRFFAFEPIHVVELVDQIWVGCDKSLRLRLSPNTVLNHTWAVLTDNALRFESS